MYNQAHLKISHKIAKTRTLQDGDNMPKKGKKGVQVKGSDVGSAPVPEYVSDEETLYGNYNNPDPDSREYYYDAVDNFHADRDKVLLERGYKAADRDAPSDEEGILDLDSEESDDEEIRALKAQLRRVKQDQRKYEYADDLEEQSEEDDEEQGLPDDKAWGSRRSRYYGDDDIDLGKMEEDNAEAVLEEKEARRLQQQMAQQLQDEDFGLDIFTIKSSKAKETTDKEDKIVKDLSKLSKKEKIQMLKKESPELLILIDDLKAKLEEAIEKLCPIRQWIEKNKITGKAADYINTKLELVLIYCTNISFYLMLKAKHVPVHNHPVIKRLVQFRKILKQLEPLDMEMAEEIEEIVSDLRDGKEIVLDTAVTTNKPFIRKQLVKKSGKRLGKKRKMTDLVSDSEHSDLEESSPRTKSKKGDGDQYETKDEVEALKYYQMMKAGRPDQRDEEDEDIQHSGEEGLEEGDEEDEEGLDGKRAISYQIEKNKGLTAHKKKELRNPRVKHRMKYRKAKIRRKGQFREPRTEMHRYGGEISGIRAGIKRGIKLR